MEKYQELFGDGTRKYCVGKLEIMSALRFAGRKGDDTIIDEYRKGNVVLSSVYHEAGSRGYMKLDMFLKEAESRLIIS